MQIKNSKLGQKKCYDRSARPFKSWETGEKCKKAV